MSKNNVSIFLSVFELERRPTNSASRQFRHNRQIKHIGTD